METALRNVNNFLGYGEGNKESLTELLVSLLVKVTPPVSCSWNKVPESFKFADCCLKD